jgi:N-acetylglucosaminyldiphosphoundecaprenol N-acetyl-beta-D-mannosaminyltransferase
LSLLTELNSAQNQNSDDSASARANGRFRVLGVPVDAVQIPGVIGQISRWIDERRSTRYVAVTGMHGITESLRDPHFRVILKAADLVVPDGMPLVWIGRLRGQQIKRRVYGPELMETFCRDTGPRYRHFFYGGAAGVPEDLAQVMQDRHGIRVAGAYSPPFRPLTSEEDRELIQLIDAAAPDVLWIGLSTPKQERWMYEHRDKIGVPVMLGVGAAFDLNTNRLKQAPRWMRENGLEWFFRLLAEPKRLWRRYLVFGSHFVFNVCLEFLGLKQFE